MTKNLAFNRRTSGILLHPTSLPGPHGNGDLGSSAYRFAEYLARAGQAWWQMLPVGPTGAVNSPYQSYSAFAGNPLLISLDKLAQLGLLTPDDLRWDGPDTPSQVNFAAAAEFRKMRLRKAFTAFEKKRRSFEYERFIAFCQTNAWWLSDYALFCMLKQAHGGVSWVDWAPELRVRQAGAIDQALKKFGKEAYYYQFQQYQFVRQWAELKDFCRGLGIGLIGDIPIFVAHDSADVWVNPGQFYLQENGQPEVVAGVPPDYFSVTGQKWGNPLYRWPVMQERGFDWWIARFRATFTYFDAVRLDHFIGFHRYWEIPGDAPTAETGRWMAGPGADFFTKIMHDLGPVAIIAEDLGLITPEVKALRDQFAFPGMRVLQFAFGTDESADEFRPHNFPRNCVVYTGTHDNDTTQGWFRARGRKASVPDQKEREMALRYMGTKGQEFNWEMIRMAWMSVANTAIIPAQDLLGLGSEARMNLPGRTEGEWGWRLQEGDLTPEIGRRLELLTATYGRNLPATGAALQPADLAP